MYDVYAVPLHNMYMYDNLGLKTYVVGDYMESLYCGHLGDMVKCPVYKGVLISVVSFKRGSTVYDIHVHAMLPHTCI